MKASLRVALPFACVLLCLQACAVRSISNPGRPWDGGNTTYRGELSDFGVIGRRAASPDAPAQDVRLRRGQRALVVQSGAAFPDERMLSGLAKHFEVGTVSGIPDPSDRGEGMIDAAARGGFDVVIAYWGILESRERPTEGKFASWVPIGGFFVPDEAQQMRIRTRIVVVDVKTGRWSCVMPQPIEDERESAFFNRLAKDREQVVSLADAAYVAAIEHIAGLIVE